MTIQTVSAKIDLRLNKGASGDYDNIWSFQKQEAFNKGINDWVRRQKNGVNAQKEGDEETSMKVDDLQPLLKKEPIGVRNKDRYAETDKLPLDYLYFKRITPVVSKGICNNVTIKSHLREEANVDDIIQLPSFNFEETFHTMIGNKINIYHNNDFKIDKAELVYYRKPKIYDFKKLSSVIEFKDDICEILVDEACEIIASDIESINQKQIARNRADINT